jgi:hypothetical protein
MAQVNIGAHIGEEGVSFFGMDEVNALLAQGQKVTKIEEGQVLVEEVPLDESESDEDEPAYAIAGFEIVVTLA